MDWSGLLDNVSNATATRWIAAVVFVLVALVVGSRLRVLIRRTAHNQGAMESAVAITSRVVQSIVVVLAVAVALRWVGIDLAPILASAGVAGIVVGFALKDLAENYIAGLVLGFRRPFVIGDEIVVAETFTGRVEELSLRYTRLRSRDGLRVYLPNAMLLREPLLNLTVNGSRRGEFTIGVGYHEGLDRARHVAMAAAGEVEGVLGDPAPQAWVEEFDRSWVTLLIRFWYAPNDSNKGRRSAVMAAVHGAFHQHDIDMPNPEIGLRLLQRFPPQEDGSDPEVRTQ